jgi:hypothetical protein
MLPDRRQGLVRLAAFSLVSGLFEEGLLGRRQGQEQCPRLTLQRPESVAQVKRNRSIVLGIDEQREGGGRVRHGPMHRVHQHRRGQPAPLKLLVHRKTADASAASAVISF